MPIMLKDLMIKLLTIYTQEELKDLLGVSLKSIDNYKNGSTPNKKKQAQIKELYTKVSENNWKKVNGVIKSNVGSITNYIGKGEKKITVDQEKLIQRMCEWIAVTAASTQVLKAELIALKSRVTGENAAAISVELDALIAKVDSNLWEEFLRKWS